MATNNKPYPGMLGSEHEAEFFNHDNQVKVICGGTISALDAAPFKILKAVRAAIDGDTAVQRSLQELYPKSEVKRLEKFITCRFGGLDHQADVLNNELQDGEYWPCPLHGNCKHEGILCKLPVVNEQRLTALDVSLIRESTTDKKNEVIADELSLPLGTFHKYKLSVHRKLGVSTKQQLTIAAGRLNII